MNKYLLLILIPLICGCASTKKFVSNFFYIAASGAQGMQQSLSGQRSLYEQQAENQESAWKQYQEQQYRNQQLEYQRRQAEALENVNNPYYQPIKFSY